MIKFLKKVPRKVKKQDFDEKSILESVFEKESSEKKPKEGKVSLEDVFRDRDEENDTFLDKLLSSFNDRPRSRNIERLEEAYYESKQLDRDLQRLLRKIDSY